MADRLVDLEFHLPAVQDQGGDLAGTLGRVQQVDGLAADALGLLDQPERADVLPARRLDVTTERVGIASGAACRRRPPRWPRCRRPSARTTCSIAAPSDDANHVERRKRSSPASANVTPCTDCIRRVPSINRATFSSSGTVNGSSCIGPRHVATTGSTGESDTGGRRAARAPPSRSRRRASAVRTTSASSRRDVSREPPPAADQDADPTPDGRRAVDALHLLVADGQRLGLVGAGPRIGVVGSGASWRPRPPSSRRPAPRSSSACPPGHLIRLRCCARGATGPGGTGASYPVTAASMGLR